jgi:hypothetical protein
VPFKDGKPQGYYQNFVTGFWVSGQNRAEVWGRPTALAVSKDGVRTTPVARFGGSLTAGQSSRWDSRQATRLAASRSKPLRTFGTNLFLLGRRNKLRQSGERPRASLALDTMPPTWAEVSNLEAFASCVWVPNYSLIVPSFARLEGTP